MKHIDLTLPWYRLNEDTEAVQQLLQKVLPEYLHTVRWFGGKAKTIQDITVSEWLTLEKSHAFAWLLMLDVHYETGLETYMLPLMLSSAVPAHNKALLATCAFNSTLFYVVDAAFDSRFHQLVFTEMMQDAMGTQTHGNLVFHSSKKLESAERLFNNARVPDIEQSNTSVLYGEVFFLKFYRKLFRQINPEVEMLQFLSEHTSFRNIPEYAGSIVWEEKSKAPVTLGLMMRKVEAEKDSWSSTGDDLNDFLFRFVDHTFSVKEYVFEKMELLGKRTAEMHLALAGGAATPAFQSEKFTKSYTKWLHEHLIQLVDKRLMMYEQQKHQLSGQALQLGEQFVQRAEFIKSFFRSVTQRKLMSGRIRIHGDYHLGQVLFSGNDFIIIDFEGEPESSIEERKIKHSPLKDVAGMIRSFHYAVCAKLYFSKETAGMDQERLQKAADRWFHLIQDTFLDSYMAVMGKNNPLLGSKAEINYLLQLHILEKAVYELGYEMNGRPHWVSIPLKGVAYVVDELEKYLE